MPKLHFSQRFDIGFLAGVCLCCLLIFGVSTTKSKQYPYTAHQGVIDMSKWSPERQPVTTLRGQWWIDYRGKKSLHPVRTPLESLQHNRWPASEVAVYAVRIQLPQAALGKVLKLYLPKGGPYFEVYANQTRVARNGLHPQSQHFSSSRTQSALPFTLQTNTLDLRIVLQPQGDHITSLRGGVLLGLSESIDAEIMRQQATFALILGAALIFTLYYLFLFVQRRDKSYLYFCLFACVSMLYIDAYHAHLLEYFWRELPLDVSLRMTRFALYAFLPITILYINAAFETRLMPYITEFATFSSLILMLTLFLPTRWMSMAFWVFLPLLVLLIGCALIMLYRAWFLKRKGIGLFIVTNAIFALCCANDTLHHLQLIASAYTLPWGFLILSLGHAILLAQRFQDHFETSQRLSHELQQNNLELDLRVKERTLKLQEQTDQLEALMQFKEQVVHTLAHDISTPLNVLLHYADQQPSAREQKRVQKAAQNMQHMLKNLQSVQSLKQPTLPLVYEEHNLTEILKKALGVFEAHLHTRQIHLNIEVPEKLMLYGDAHILLRVFQNLISNALKSMGPKGIFQIQGYTHGGHIELLFRDNGPGFQLSTDQALGWRVSGFENQELPSQGIGLSFCQLALEAHQGSLTLRNNEKGAEVHICLPIKPQHLVAKEVQLTSSQAQLLKPLFEKLSPVAFYEASKLHQIMHQFQRLNTTEAADFMRSLQHSIEAFDETQYKKLMEQLERAYTYR